MPVRRDAAPAIFHANDIDVAFAVLADAPIRVHQNEQGLSGICPRRIREAFTLGDDEKRFIDFLVEGAIAECFPTT